MTEIPLTQVSSVNLEYYKKQAKALLKARRAGDPVARDRMHRFETGEEPALHVAQRAIAHEQGFASWPKFQAFIIESSLDFQGLVARFIDAATSDGRRAADMLADHPEIAGAGVYAALVLGDWQRVAEAIAADPDWVNTKSGPENVEPLVYVCFSRFAHPRNERAPGLALTARLLLENGADPDTAAEVGDDRLSCLYAASGLLNNAELTRLLLDAGADPNTPFDDGWGNPFKPITGVIGQGEGSRPEHPQAAALVQLLLDRGADPNETFRNEFGDMPVLYGAAGVAHDPQTTRAGADPNGEPWFGDALYHATEAESSECLRLLLEHGAES